MPQFCCIVNCGSRGERDNYSFHNIPRLLNFKHKTDLNQLSKLRRDKWLTAIKREDWTDSKLKNAKVCGKHFLLGKPAELKEHNIPDWVPSLNMGYDNHKETSKRKAGKRWERLVNRNNKMLHHESLTSPLQVQSEEVPNLLDEASTKSAICDITTQTQLTMNDLSELFLNLCEVKTLQNRLQLLTISCASLYNDNNKCKYYTGLDTTVLQVIVADLTPFVQMHHNTKLPATEQILFTFMKLRLNLDFKDLSYRFGISPTVASTYFKAIIEIMFARFQKLIFWPDQVELQKTIPFCFKEAFHDKTSIIIDCFEIFVETPTNPYAAAQCWSNYKHHQTIKYLIGITPQGSVCYISDGWGGRASDQFVTLQSNFCDFLRPGDVVLAERGFLIKEFVNLFRATVKTPAFTKGQTQMHPVDLENIRSIASVSIHVERVIGLIRQKYTILDGVMQMSTVCSGYVNQIVFVCCALINLCPPVIPLE